MNEITPNQPNKERNRSFETVSIFTIPDQTEELDFAQLVENSLFNRNFYLDNITREGDFGKMVIETSTPFNRVKGREYQRVRRLRKISDGALMAVLKTEPISLNEWRYLFSQLTREQLAPTFQPIPGNGVHRSETTTFYVKFDDGKVRVIRTLFAWGGGPHQYSISIEEFGADTYGLLKNTKVISPKS